MKRNAFVLPALAALVFCPGVVFAQSQTEQEITQLIIDGYDYSNTNLKNRPGREGRNLGHFRPQSGGGRWLSPRVSSEI